MTKVLIVEDNEENREMLVRRLLRRDFQVLAAEDGHTALLLARSEHPDIILMDVGLPEINGLDVTRALKIKPQTAGIPVIVLTAHAREEDRTAAIAAGADGFATKPVDIESLVTSMNDLLEERIRAA